VVPKIAAIVAITTLMRALISALRPDGFSGPENRDLLVPDIITGAIGWVVGTHLGIGIPEGLAAAFP
jgi:hypothetical protein